jgi:hypothetical protein
VSDTGWTCPAGGNICSRSDPLNGGAGYPAISVIAKVATDAAGILVNHVDVAGGGAAAVSADDSADISPITCNVNGDAVTDVLDVQSIIGEALGLIAPLHDIDHDGLVGVTEVQKVVHAVISLACS